MNQRRSHVVGRIAVLVVKTYVDNLRTVVRDIECTAPAEVLLGDVVRRNLEFHTVVLRLTDVFGDGACTVDGRNERLSSKSRVRDQ